MTLKATVLVIVAILALAAAHPVRQHFLTFERQYSKIYRSEHERQRRFNIFADNLAKIERYNQNPHGTKYELNPYADLTAEEFKGKFYNMVHRLSTSFDPTLGSSHPHVEKLTVSKEDDSHIPNEFDWAREGAVTPVVNQGVCGSCWAITSATVLESQHYLQTRELVPLSPQQLLDCDHRDAGCQGGWYFDAWFYVQKSGGIMAAADYPYMGITHDDKCHRDAHKYVTTVTHVSQPDSNDPRQLKHLLFKYGPFASAMHVTDDFQFYSHGTYVPHESCSGEINHAVTVVGYGTDMLGRQYFRVKNSWGHWGMDGYFDIEATACHINKYWGIAFTDVQALKTAHHNAHKHEKHHE